MKTIIFVSLCLCLLVSITAEKSSHKHAGKLLKSGHELKGSNANLDAAADAKSPLPLPADSQAVKPAAREGGGGRKHHRNGKNKKGAHHQQEQQQQQQHTGRSRKSHGKSKVNNNNGPTKTHNKHGRKHGRGKQAQ